MPPLHFHCQWSSLRRPVRILLCIQLQLRLLDSIHSIGCFASAHGEDEPISSTAVHVNLPWNDTVRTRHSSAASDARHAFVDPCAAPVPGIDQLEDARAQARGFGYGHVWPSEAGWPVSPSDGNNSNDGHDDGAPLVSVRSYRSDSLGGCARLCKEDGSPAGTFTFRSLGDDRGVYTCLCHGNVECLDPIFVVKGAVVFSTVPEPERCSYSLCDRWGGAREYYMCCNRPRVRVEREEGKEMPQFTYHTPPARPSEAPPPPPSRFLQILSSIGVGTGMSLDRQNSKAFHTQSSSPRSMSTTSSNSTKSRLSLTEPSGSPGVQQHFDAGLFPTASTRTLVAPSEIGVPFVTNTTTTASSPSGATVGPNIDGQRDEALLAPISSPTASTNTSLVPVTWNPPLNSTGMSAAPIRELSSNPPANEHEIESPSPSLSPTALRGPSFVPSTLPLGTVDKAASPVPLSQASAGPSDRSSESGLDTPTIGPQENSPTRLPGESVSPSPHSVTSPSMAPSGTGPSLTTTQPSAEPSTSSAPAVSESESTEPSTHSVTPTVSESRSLEPSGLDPSTRPSRLPPSFQPSITSAPWNRVERPPSISPTETVVPSRAPSAASVSTPPSFSPTSQSNHPTLAPSFEGITSPPPAPTVSEVELTPFHLTLEFQVPQNSNQSTGTGLNTAEMLLLTSYTEFFLATWYKSSLSLSNVLVNVNLTASGDHQSTRKLLASRVLQTRTRTQRRTQTQGRELQVTEEAIAYTGRTVFRSASDEWLPPSTSELDALTASAFNGTSGKLYVNVLASEAAALGGGGLLPFVTGVRYQAAEGQGGGAAGGDDAPLTGGAIVGIALGCSAGFVLLVAGFAFLRRRSFKARCKDAAKAASADSKRLAVVDAATQDFEVGSGPVVPATPSTVGDAECPTPVRANRSNAKDTLEADAGVPRDYSPTLSFREGAQPTDRPILDVSEKPLKKRSIIKSIRDLGSTRFANKREKMVASNQGSFGSLHQKVDESSSMASSRIQGPGASYLDGYDSSVAPPSCFLMDEDVSTIVIEGTSQIEAENNAADQTDISFEELSTLDDERLNEVLQFEQIIANELSGLANEGDGYVTMGEATDRPYTGLMGPEGGHITNDQFEKETKDSLPSGSDGSDREPSLGNSSVASSKSSLRRIEEKCDALLIEINDTTEGPSRDPQAFVGHLTSSDVAPQSPPGGDAPQMQPGGIAPQTPRGGEAPQTPCGGDAPQTPPGGITPQTLPGGIGPQTPPGGIASQTRPRDFISQPPPNVPPAPSSASQSSSTGPPEIV